MSDAGALHWRHAEGRWLCRLGIVSAAGILAACQGQQYDVDLIMTPSTAGACEVPVAVEVHWDASRLGLKQAYLEFGSLGRGAQRWREEGSVGTAKTEAWVTDGTTVTLRSMNNVVLAKRTFTTTVCPDKDWL